MLKRLDVDDYGLARPLFAPIDHHLAIGSILAGLTPGPVYVDDGVKPQLALTWTRSRVFVAGEIADSALLAALGDLIVNVFYPLCADSGPGAFTLMYTPRLEEQLRRCLSDQNLIPDKRHYYHLHSGQFRREAILPAGYELVPVSRELLENRGIANRVSVLQEMQSERPSVEDFLEKSFGTCILHEQAIVGWCMSEYNFLNRCEIGIYVEEAERRRGLAKAGATAVIAKGQQLGVNEIGWHCWRNNEPSKATAKSLGFELVREERVLFAYTDDLENLAVNGYISLRDGSAEQSLQWFEKAMQVGELPAWALPYWEKARSILAVRR